MELTDQQFLEVLTDSGFATKDGERIRLQHDLAAFLGSNTDYRTDLGVQRLNDKAFLHALGVEACPSDANADEHADTPST